MRYEMADWRARTRPSAPQSGKARYMKPRPRRLSAFSSFSSFSSLFSIFSILIPPPPHPRPSHRPRPPAPLAAPIELLYRALIGRCLHPPGIVAQVVSCTPGLHSTSHTAEAANEPTLCHLLAPSTPPWSTSGAAAATSALLMLLSNVHCSSPMRGR